MVVFVIGDSCDCFLWWWDGCCCFVVVGGGVFVVVIVFIVDNIIFAINITSPPITFPIPLPSPHLHPFQPQHKRHLQLITTHPHIHLTLRKYNLLHNFNIILPLSLQMLIQNTINNFNLILILIFYSIKFHPITLTIWIEVLI